MKPKKDGTHMDDVMAWMGAVKAPVCCYTCEHYNQKTGYCNEHKDGPPTEFKERGCDQWQETVPF